MDRPLLDPSEPPPRIYDAPELELEDAEKAVLQSMETPRRTNEGGGGGGGRGEASGRPRAMTADPLGRLGIPRPEAANRRRTSSISHHPNKGGALRASMKFRSAVQRVMREGAPDARSRSPKQRRGHRKTASTAAAALEALQEPVLTRRSVPYQASVQNAFDDPWFKMEEEEEEEEEQKEETKDEDLEPTSETLPLRNGESYGSLDSLTDRGISQRLKVVAQKKRGFSRKLAHCCHPRRIGRFLWQLFLHSFVMLLAIPLAIIAAVCFYGFGNPSPDFLLKTATISWWCNFLARQAVTLEMGRIAQFLMVDRAFLNNRLALHIFGPFFTLFAMQARGWPFVLFVWGFLDLFLLHGDDKFQLHWLFWTGLDLYSDKANSGAVNVLNSGVYLRLLVCMILAGLFTALNRTFFALYFGRRQYNQFKPRLEKILADTVLLHEVAVLAANGEKINDLMEKSNADNVEVELRSRGRGGLADVTWTSVRFEEGDVSLDYSADEESDLEEADEPLEETAEDRKGMLRRDSSGSLQIKELLERWEEPVMTRNQKDDVPIEDVLRFRRALAFMDEKEPFGEDFGPAATRDECIESAHHVFCGLEKLSSSSGKIPFSVFELLCVQDDGNTTDPKKRAALRKLFRPDAEESLSLLMFVTSCDSVYRRLRYFRASVENGTILDQTLEGIFRGFYYLVLSLVLLSILQVNVWSLLLSITSLLVSLSFAFGNVASSYVQGIMLITVSRPFDLGDRIFLMSPGTPETGFGNVGNTWFVEDISMGMTKLRFARTGEVSYVANHLLAGMRIYNCNRSPSANVVLEFDFHINFLEGDNVKKFKAALENYCKKFPRKWDSLVVFIPVSIDPNNEKVRFFLAVRHRNTWQEAKNIQIHRGDLIRFIYATAENMNVNYDDVPSRMLCYVGGSLEQGATDALRSSLLKPENIHSSTKLLA